jgi:nucleoside-diphosphate-sugar epimerase
MIETINSIDQLDDLLSEPSRGAIEALGRLEGDLLLLGVGGKMGPTLAKMAVRASQAAGIKRRVYGVARFTNAQLPDWLERNGVEPVKCDLLDAEQIAGLPEAKNVIVMTALKFGSTGRPGDTWAVNCWSPALICQRFKRSTILGFSTGNVYPLTPVTLGGSVESDLLMPIGEYAASCVGRERLYDYFSRSFGTKIAIARLNYASELRYGVLVDLARQVQAGQPIDLSMPAVNVIWQGDANAMILQALGQATSPPFVVNIAGPETLSVRRLAEWFAAEFGTTAKFVNEGASDALLSNGQLGHRLFGYPRVSIQQLCRWTAQWLASGGELLDKPTHFQVTSGRF